MRDLIFKFADEASASTALPDWRMDVEGELVWSPLAGCGVRETVVVTAQAVIDDTDPANPVVVNPREVDPSYWLVLTVPGNGDRGFDADIHPALLDGLMTIDGFHVSEPAGWQAEFTAGQIAAMIAAAKDKANKVVVEFADGIGRTFTAGYPNAEVQSWPTKLLAAKAVVAGKADAGQTAMIEREASLIGMETAVLAKAIIAKAITFETAVSMIAGIRQKTQAAIASAANEQEIQTVLMSAEQEAETALAGIV